jgi:PAS domain S-box-containing protein
MRKEELLGKTVFDLYSAEIAQAMTNDDLDVFKSKRPKLDIVEPYESPTGIRWIRTHKIPTIDEVGNATGLIGFSEEITEHKKAEDALKESQKRYQNLIETTADFIYELDNQGRYTYCSPQMEKLWGFKPEEMIGKTPFDRMPKKDKERIFALFKSFMTSPRPLIGLITSSVDSKGRPRVIETNGVPFFDDQGKVIGYRGISRDITDRKKTKKPAAKKRRDTK